MSGESDTRAGPGSGLTHVSLINAALAYRAPCYSPPYDSPIEDSFAYSMVKLITSRCDPGAPVRGSHLLGDCSGSTLQSPPRRRPSGVERDGQEFHQGLDAVRDAWPATRYHPRSDGSAQAIYRLRRTGKHRTGMRRGPALPGCPTSTRQMFSDRGRGLLRHLASDSAMESSTRRRLARGTNLIFVPTAPLAQPCRAG